MLDLRNHYRGNSLMIVVSSMETDFPGNSFKLSRFPAAPDSLA